MKSPPAFKKARRLFGGESLGLGHRGQITGNTEHRNGEADRNENPI